MNKVILKGNVGKDPEVKKFENGSVAKFSLATSESYTDKKGERITNTEWHNVVFWGKITDVIEKYVKKGNEILVEGKNVTRKYDDKDGITHWSTEVVCHAFEFCGTKERVEQKENNEGKWQGKREVSAMSDINELPGANDDNPDNMPF